MDDENNKVTHSAPPISDHSVSEIQKFSEHQLVSDELEWDDSLGMELTRAEKRKVRSESSEEKEESEFVTVQRKKKLLERTLRS